MNASPKVNQLLVPGRQKVINLSCAYVTIGRVLKDFIFLLPYSVVLRDGLDISGL
jgi:hypothetical protein